MFNKLLITIFLRSGNSFSFKCKKFSISRTDKGKLAALEWQGGNGQISEIDIKEIEAITARNVWF